MCGLDNLEALFVISAFLFQIVLIIHFAVRKRVFKVALRYGWIVYWLSVPAAVVSVLLLSGGKVWWLWLGGFVYLVWQVSALLSSMYGGSSGAIPFAGRSSGRT
jgi:hypothetical protein